MMAIFHDMIEKTMEVFIDDFSVFRNSFGTCISHLDKMLKRCEDTNIFLNLEKTYFMVKEGIVLGHKISKNGIDVDKAKVDVITKIPHPTTIKENMKDLLEPYPKFFTLAGTILWLWDDLGTAKLLEFIHGLWKDLNGELVAPNVVLSPMIRVAFNMSRASQVVYQHNKNSYLSSVKEHVKNLFFKPIDM
nr:reverse transcriptase domain-containing protein [Tanacetum cinerariifolium]